MTCSNDVHRRYFTEPSSSFYRIIRRTAGVAFDGYYANCAVVVDLENKWQVRRASGLNPPLSCLTQAGSEFRVSLALCLAGNPKVPAEFIAVQRQ